MDDVGPVQAVLIVCTLVVTLILSAVIIAVIVRLSRSRRPRDDIISGHVTAVRGSRASVRQCAGAPDVDNMATGDGCSAGWRSRSSSLSRGGVGGGKVADYERRPAAAGGRTAVCDGRDVSDRLVVNTVERVLCNGECGGRWLTDEQWRLYTWEDT